MSVSSLVHEAALCSLLHVDSFIAKEWSMKVYKNQQNHFSIRWEWKLTILAARPFEAQWTLTYLAPGLRTLASIEACVATAQPCGCHKAADVCTRHGFSQDIALSNWYNSFVAGLHLVLCVVKCCSVTHCADIPSLHRSSESSQGSTDRLCESPCCTPVCKLCSMLSWGGGIMLESNKRISRKFLYGFIHIHSFFKCSLVDSMFKNMPSQMPLW